MTLFGWEHSLGWLAFLSLIPFILLYFIRPKPQELEVPSLMFFMKSQFTDKEHSFFKRFTKDWLFLLQLLVLLLLSLYFVDPYTSVGGATLVDHAVFVLDVSASMQAGDRFAQAVTAAKDRLARSNTFILVSTVPRVGATDLSKPDAERYLTTLRATAGRSNLGDALLLSAQYVKSDESKVYVISDFIPTEGSSIEAAKNSLQAKGVTPELISVKGDKVLNNVGIVDVKVDETSTTIYVKNYNAQEEKVTLQVHNEQKKLTIASKSTEPYSFKTLQGITEISLVGKDDFSPDNIAYVSVPEQQQINVLLITDKASKYLTSALQSSGKVLLTLGSSKRLPQGEYDVYVIHAIANSLSKDVLSSLENEVQEGKSVIIHVQPDSGSLSYGTLLPLALGKYHGEGAVEVEQLTKLTKDIVFGSVSRYYATADEEGIILAKVQNHSILSLASKGSGKILYYGIIEEESNFKLQPSYPIFWTNALRLLAGIGDLQTFNVDSGSLLSLPSKTEVITPSKKLTTATIFFDEAGIYKVHEKLIASSLADERESDINALEAEEGITKAQDALSGIEESRYSLEKILIIAAGILLLFELLIMKRRGEV